MNAHPWCNETTEMHVCKLSMGLEKPEFYKIMPIIGSWLVCICRVMVHLGILLWLALSRDRLGTRALKFPFLTTNSKEVKKKWKGQNFHSKKRAMKKNSTTDKLDDIIQRTKDYMARSSGGGLWVIGIMLRSVYSFMSRNGRRPRLEALSVYSGFKN